MINFINIQYTMDSRNKQNYQTSDVTLLLCVCGGDDCVCSVWVEGVGESERDSVCLNCVFHRVDGLD